MKKEHSNDQENFILKKIRYYQGSIKDFEDFWNSKISDGESEESDETKSLRKRNDELNKAFEIIPLERECGDECDDECDDECRERKKKKHIHKKIEKREP